MDSLPVLRWAWLCEQRPGPGELAFAEIAAAIALPLVVWCYFGWGIDRPDEWQAMLVPFPAEHTYVLSDTDDLARFSLFHRLGPLVEMVEKRYASL